MVGHSPTPPPGARSAYNSSNEGTRPRIAAMERGPGPARYKLPGTTGINDHDPSMKKNPAYSFGMRTRQFSGTGINSCRCVHVLTEAGHSICQFYINKLHFSVFLNVYWYLLYCFAVIVNSTSEDKSLEHSSHCLSYMVFCNNSQCGVLPWSR